jgi:DNA-binding response OmpR family regulator
MGKLKILSVDDSKSIHAFLRDCLSQTTYSLECVFDGEEAILKIKENPNSFDLILLDWEMPIKDGPSTLQELRGMGIKIPIVMLTSKNDPEDILQMIQAGVSEYMMKPFTADILIEKIQQVLSE